jgi:hypothetical protein
MRAWSLGGRAATAAALALGVRGCVRMTAARLRSRTRVDSLLWDRG